MMTDNYDPFAGYDKYREIHQRINAVHRQNQMEGKSNQPLAADFSKIDAMAEQMSRIDFVRIDELDRNPIANKLAAEMMELHTAEWRKFGSIPFDTRFCPGFDETSPDTRPYALTYGQDYVLYPLEYVSDWEAVAALAITSGNSGCGTHLSVFCDSGTPAEAFPVKRGELICVFTSCIPCLEHLHDSRAREYNYIGPREHWMATPAQTEPDSKPDPDDWD